MLRTLLAVLLLACTTGCGTFRYNRAWSDFASAARAETEAETGGMTGRWKGRWESELNGHSGGLRCMLTPLDEGRYEAWFHSTYARILSFQYTTVFDVEAVGDTHSFSGAQDLGKMAGGVYRYAGTVEGDRFHATFEAENGDHGTFEMQRVP